MKRLAIFLVAASVGYLHHESIVRSAPQRVPQDEQLVRIFASRFEFKPSQIRVKKGVPVMLELASQDRHHGFKLPQFRIRVDVKPGAVENVRFVPDRTGSFTFLCDVFCGEGHEEMSGVIEVTE